MNKRLSFSNKGRNEPIKFKHFTFNFSLFKLKKPGKGVRVCLESFSEQLVQVHCSVLSVVSSNGSSNVERSSKGAVSDQVGEIIVASNIVSRLLHCIEVLDSNFWAQFPVILLDLVREDQIVGRTDPVHSPFVYLEAS